MCACRQKKSFFIEDILKDTRKKPYKNLSYEPSKPLICNKISSNTNPEKADEADTVKLDQNIVYSDNESRTNLGLRRNTYPLCPTPVKPDCHWNYRGKDAGPVCEYGRLSYYSDQVLNTGRMLRNQLAVNRFATHPYAVRQPFGFDRVPPDYYSPWWGMGGRRKGGQVRFTAAQTGALERRFTASKYLSPDERRALATSLRLSDRQVKTWFQNRRAKWRRTTPDSADPGSPPSADEGSDDGVIIADNDII